MAPHSPLWLAVDQKLDQWINSEPRHIYRVTSPRCVARVAATRYCRDIPRSPFHRVLRHTNTVRRPNDCCRDVKSSNVRLRQTTAGHRRASRQLMCSSVRPELLLKQTQTAVLPD